MYRGIGQPVIIPGDMGRASWVLVGQPGSMERTFGTTCHGAGRAMSRTAAVKAAHGPKSERQQEKRQHDDKDALNKIGHHGCHQSTRDTIGEKNRGDGPGMHQEHGGEVPGVSQEVDEREAAPPRRGGSDHGRHGSVLC
jgi:hypothetical protein